MVRNQPFHVVARFRRHMNFSVGFVDNVSSVYVLVVHKSFDLWSRRPSGRLSVAC